MGYTKKRKSNKKRITRRKMRGGLRWIHRENNNGWTVEKPVKKPISVKKPMVKKPIAKNDNQIWDLNDKGKWVIQNKPPKKEITKAAPSIKRIINPLYQAHLKLRRDENISPRASKSSSKSSSSKSSSSKSPSSATKISLIMDENPHLQSGLHYTPKVKFTHKLASFLNSSPS